MKNGNSEHAVAELSYGERLLLMTLHLLCDDDGEVNISVPELADVAGLSRQFTYERTRVLIKAGLVYRRRVPGSTRYYWSVPVDLKMILWDMLGHDINQNLLTPIFNDQLKGRITNAKTKEVA